MRRITWIILLLASVGLALTFLFGPATRRAALRGSAGRLLDSLEKTYAPKHDYTPVNLVDFAEADSDFFSSATRQMEQAGFARRGDWVDRTLSEPKSGTLLLRVLAHPEDGTVAVLYQAGSTKDCSLLTEFSDGRHLTTDNPSPNQLLGRPDSILAGFAGTEEDAVALLALHRKRLAEFLQGNPEARVLVVADEAGAEAALNRYNAAEAKFRHGWEMVVTREEAVAIARWVGEDAAKEAKEAARREGFFGAFGPSAARVAQFAAELAEETGLEWDERRQTRGSRGSSRVNK